MNIVANHSGVVSIAPVTPPYNIFELDFTSTVNGNTYNIQSNFGTVTAGVVISNSLSSAGTDTINLGTNNRLGGGFPEVIPDYTGTAGTAVNVLDSADGTASTFTMSPTGLSFSGQPSHPILVYPSSNISSLTVDGSRRAIRST